METNNLLKIFLGSVPASIHGFSCGWVGVWVDQKVWSSGKFPIRDIVVQGDDLDELEEVEIL